MKLLTVAGVTDYRIVCVVPAQAGLVSGYLRLLNRVMTAASPFRKRRAGISQVDLILSPAARMTVLKFSL